MKITVIGAGYVGLVTSAAFAQFGHQVLCVDIDEERIEKLHRGELPIHEPGLETLIGRVRFATPAASDYYDADVIFVCVGTPASATGKSDLTAFWRVITEIRMRAASHPADPIIAIKSTVPVGTGDWTAKRLPYNVVVSTPEFLAEGTAVRDALRPSRVVIGHSDAPASALAKLLGLFAPFVPGGERILTMRRASAELSKYGANAMLATRITFMNEMAALCEVTGGDVLEVRDGIGSDPRIGKAFLYAGAGWGGSCFSKDVQALCATAREHGYDGMRIAHVALDVNRAHQIRLTDRILGAADGQTLCLWGLAFKPGTDDVREAPALHMVARLWNKDVRIRAYDPVAVPAFDRRLHGSGGFSGPNDSPRAAGRVQFCEADPYEAADGAHVLALVTEWPELRRPDFRRLHLAMSAASETRPPVLFDLRNVWDRAEAEAHGFEYHGVGR